MKKLREFQKFDAEAFFKEKDVRVLASEVWMEYGDGKNRNELGTKYKCVIATDNTKYSGENVQPDLNAGERIVVKVPQKAKQFGKFNRIVFVNPTGSVYGDFMSELSVKADDVEIITK